MITIKNLRQALAILVLGIILIWPASRQTLAATPNIPADCDPIPEDPDLILECNEYYNTHPQPKTYEPGTDPSNPVVFPSDGTSGIAAAYSSKTELILLVAGKLTNSSRQLIGAMVDPKTLALRNSAFRIDGNGTSGVSKVAYAPDLEKFLVVWEDSRPCASCRSEYGRFISASGAPIGLDFPINQGAAFLSGVVYDSINKKFVILYEPSGNSLDIRTVDSDGKVSGQVTVVSSFAYQGQGGLTVNTSTDEYLVTYAIVFSGENTPNEDERIYYSRVNAKTLQVAGSPIQLSKVRLGHNTFASAHIAYSAKGGAMAIWNEAGRDGTSGTWGRTIFDDGTPSAEYPVITVGNNPYSDGFASESINYNPWTDSFFVPSGDWDGNAWMTEIDLSGLVYDTRPALQAVAMVPNFFAKLFNIDFVRAAAYGNFNIASAVTPYGAATFASRNYATVVGTNFQSGNAPGPAQPAAPATPAKPSTPQDLTALPKLINQIYVWSLGLAVLLALLMIVVGGYYYMTAGGNAEQSSKGKEYITSALIGVVILFCAYLLLNTINPDLVNFNLKSLDGLNSTPASTQTKTP